MAKKRIVATGNWNSNKNPRSNPKPPKPAPAKRPAPGSAPDKAGFLQKAKNMANSYASKGFSGKRADAEVVEIRSMSCHGLPDIGLAPCEFRGTSEENEGRNYCLECGCGDRQATWLNALEEDEYTKLHFPKVSCPLKMPGFSDYIAVDKETEKRKNHYSNFERKKEIENYCQAMGVNLTIKNEPLIDVEGLLYITSPNCGWCTKADPFVDELIMEGHDINIVNMTDRESLEIANKVKEKFDIKCGTPLFVNGSTGESLCGYKEKEKIEEWANNGKKNSSE